MESSGIKIMMEDLLFASYASGETEKQKKNIMEEKNSIFFSVCSVFGGVVGALP